MLLALIIFIYLAIGGIVISGLIVACNETIFDRSFKKILKELESEGFKYAFSIWVCSLLIIGWLPLVVMAIISYIRN